jgi:hypothetical protein
VGAASLEGGSTQVRGVAPFEATLLGLEEGGAEGSVLEVFVKQVIQAYSDMLMDPTKRIMLQWIIMIYFPLKPKNKLLT